MFVLNVVPGNVCLAQDTIKQQPADTIFKIDTVQRQDSTKTRSTPGSALKKAKLEAPVNYIAEDSLRFEIRHQQVYLFKKANIKYKDIQLRADCVKIDFPLHQVDAQGVPDSTGKDIGTPEFSDGKETFKSKKMIYNYVTKKGYIQHVFTKEDEGYLHGVTVKKMENNVTYIRDGSYTTCDLEEDPHFAFKFDKGKVIPNKRIITGPAYLIIAGVPTPIAIPFGFFPNKTGQRSGIVIPTYGESPTLGFFLQDGGYYWAMNDNMDLKIIGDIYSHGSWAIKPVFRYNSRYHYNGALNLSYVVNVTGDENAANSQTTKDYQIRWVHTQDPKARPHSSFSANVDIVSSTYNKYNLAASTETYLSNTFQSSINYATTLGNNASLNLNFGHSQNTLNKSIRFTLPQVAFNVNQFYPFRRKTRVGQMKWYENISIRYSLDFENVYSTVDTLLFKRAWQKKLVNGMRQTVPISGSVKILKYFNWTNSVNITDVTYIQGIRKQFINTQVVGNDTVRGHYKTDTVYGLNNGIWGSFSSSINTRLYGMYQFRKGPVIAIRHMIQPSISFSYSPNYGSPGWGYYLPIKNDTTRVNPQKYSRFENSLYGGPPQYKSGVLNFSLGNNLEMKVRNRKDTVTGTRKIVLIENFTIAASYDLAKDTVNWSKISLSGYTTLFKNLRVQYGSTFDPYAMDSLGRRTNTSEWKAHHRLLRLDNTTWNIGLSYSFSSDKLKNKTGTTKGTKQERQDAIDYYGDYVDFNIPWSLSFNYTLNYTKDWVFPNPQRVGKLIQTLSFNGQLNLTPKWKISIVSGYDFVHGQISYTSLDLYRDLHCWEMRFGWVPKGGQQQWNFSINVKASLLQDLKLNKKKDFRDFKD